MSITTGGGATVSDATGGNWTQGTAPQPAQHACPNCGYCPACGRSGQRAWPWNPYPWYGPYYVGDPPYYPGYPYYGTITVSCDANTGTVVSGVPGGVWV